jgi:hypothetical protein
MKHIYCLIFLFFISNYSAFCQENNDTAILKVVLTKYFENEKVIVKNRLQLLNLYCNKAPNNEEINEVISKNDFIKKNSIEIKKQINPQLTESWAINLTTLFNNQNQYLKSKVNDCMEFEAFQKKSNQATDNKERLLIVNKPIYFANKFCLVRVAIYRNIEHNSGSYLLLENINSKWIIKDILNKWET